MWANIAGRTLPLRGHLPCRASGAPHRIACKALTIVQLKAAIQHFSGHSATGATREALSARLLQICKIPRFHDLVPCTYAILEEMRIAKNFAHEISRSKFDLIHDLIGPDG